jgi:NADPH:quinone reductase-like Zn-dependent oxidoreductase
MKYVADMIIQGTLKEQIGRVFEFKDTVEAFVALMSGTTPGKVVISRDQ